jgi:hypothetical protein
MLPAPSVAEVRQTIKNKPAALKVLLFAPPFSEIARKTVVPRLAYLHERSAHHVHFFCVGYSAFGPMPRDTSETVCVIGGVNWFFNPKHFAEFISELEVMTNWKYSGESELIILGAGFEFQETGQRPRNSEVVIFDLEAMLRDDAISHTAELLEAIVRFARRNGSPDAAVLSDDEGVRLLGKTLADSILDLLPRPAARLWRQGRHYCVQNLAR